MHIEAPTNKLVRKLKHEQISQTPFNLSLVLFVLKKSTASVRCLGVCLRCWRGHIVVPRIRFSLGQHQDQGLWPGPIYAQLQSKSGFVTIHYLHNPIIHLYYPTKRLHDIVCNFSWDMKMSQEKSKTMPMQIFGGKRGVLWDLCK